MPKNQEQTVEIDRFVSIGRAAAMLDCHIETLRRWDRDGRITTYRTPGGQRRFKVADLQAALCQGQE